MEKSKGDINIKGKFAAGRDINISKYSNFKWLIGSLFILVFIAFGWIYRADFSNYFNSFKKFQSQDSEQLKILLLPFRAQQDHQDVEVDYKDELITSLIEKKDRDSLNIDLLSIDGIESPKTDKEAEAIAIDKNADIVIWGSYVEALQGPKKLRLRYLLIKDFQLPYLNMKASDKEEDLDYDISNLKNGYLQNDLYYLLNWIGGISAFNQNDYRKALKNFYALKNDSLLLHQYEFYALDNLAEIFLVLGREEFAFPIFEVLHSKVEEASATITSLEKASMYTKIGIAFGYHGNADKSVENHLKAIDILENSKERGKEYKKLQSSIYSNLGVQYIRMTLLEKAEKCFDVCLKVDSTLMEKGVNENERREILNNSVNMALLKSKKGKFDEALKLLIETEEKAKEVLDANDRLWGNIYNNIGEIYYRSGDYEEAIKYQKKDMLLSEVIYDKFHRDLIPTYSNMAVYYENIDSIEKSLFYLEKAIKIAEYGDQNQATDDLAALYSNYAITLADNEQFDQSIQFNQKSIDIREKGSNANTNSQLATSYNNMSYTYRRMEKYDEALIYHRKAVDISKRLLGEDNIYTSIYYSKMVESYIGQKKYLAAMEIIEKIEPIYERNLPREHSLFIDLMTLKEKCLSNLN